MRTTLALLASTILIGLSTPALAADAPRPLAAGDTLIGGQLGIYAAEGTSIDTKWAHLVVGHLVTDWLAIGGSVGAAHSPFIATWSAGLDATAFVELSPRFYFTSSLGARLQRFGADYATDQEERLALRAGLLVLPSEHIFARFDVGGVDLVHARGRASGGYSGGIHVNGQGMGFAMAGGGITLGLRL